MDYLRWILLLAGIFFVLIIYLVGRNNKKQNNVYDDVEGASDLPEFRVNDRIDDWQDLDESVGQVRIVARENDEYDSYDDEDLPLTDEIETDVEKYSDNESVDTVEQSDDNQGEKESVIVLHILAKSSDRLSGDKINSAAQANGLKFGEMNIFHRIDDGRSVFSMTNMVEPGVFDPDTMHELRTPGLTLFMQKNDSNNVVAFEDMLECAYHISEMLDAQLCNRQRQPLTQTDAEQYRELATDFDR